MISLVSDQNECGEKKHILNINILINLIVIMTLIEIIITMTFMGFVTSLKTLRMFPSLLPLLNFDAKAVFYSQ